MNLRDKIWKYATAFVVVLIILNPEMIELALFVDAIGLDMFLMLFEIQILAILGAWLNTRNRLILTYIQHFIEDHLFGISWKSVKEEPACLAFAAPTQATLMHLLVFSAVAGMMSNVQL